MLVAAHYVNAYQVWRYLGLYQAMAGSFDDGRMQQLGELFVRAASQHAELLSKQGMNVEGELEVVRLYRRYLDETLAMCREKWATFNVTLMMLGIILLVTATLAIVLLLLLTPRVSLGLLVSPAAVGAAVGAVLSPALPLILSDVSWVNSLLVVSSLVSSAAVLARLAPITSRVLTRGVIGSWRLGELVSAFSLLCYLQGLFTNSYIIIEHDVVYFLAMSILLASTASTFRQPNDSKSWLSAAVPVIALRSTCELDKVLPSSLLSSTFYSHFELVCILVSLILLPLLLYRLYPASTTPSRRLISKYIFPVGCLLCLLYWTLQSSSSSSDSVYLPLLDGYVVRIVVPHLVYASSYIGLAVLLCVRFAAQERADQLNTHTIFLVHRHFWASFQPIRSCSASQETN